MKLMNTKKFLCSYSHDGSQWSVTIDAYDFKDAEARCKKLGYLRLDGEVMARFPAKVGLLVRLVCWLRNRFAGLIPLALALLLGGRVSYSQPMPTAGSNAPPALATNAFLLIMPTNAWCVKHGKAFIVSKIISETFVVGGVDGAGQPFIESNPFYGAKWTAVRRLRCPKFNCSSLTETNEVYIPQRDVKTALEQLKKRKVK